MKVLLFSFLLIKALTDSITITVYPTEEMNECMLIMEVKDAEIDPEGFFYMVALMDSDSEEKVLPETLGIKIYTYPLWTDQNKLEPNQEIYSLPDSYLSKEATAID